MQPVQWSSEFNDEELGLVYYIYRHFNPLMGRWIGRDMLEKYHLIMNLYSYNSNKVAAIDTLGLETQTCCPKEIIADFSTFTPYQDANLEDLDDELREEWRNNPQYDFEDAALTSSYRKRHKNPYPVDENDATKSKNSTKNKKYGYYGGIWDGTLILKFDPKNKCEQKEYDIQAGGRADGYQGSSKNTTAPVAGNGRVSTELKQTGKIAGYRIGVSSSDLIHWYDNRSDILIHLAPLFIPGSPEKRHRGSHGCVSLRDSSQWDELAKHMTACKKLRKSSIPITIKGAEGYPQ